MTDAVAYSSTAPAVRAAWTSYKDHAQDVRARRTALQERIGRDLLIRRHGFGHDTYVSSFAAGAADKPGDVIGSDRALRVAKAGPEAGRIIPNLQCKAGKDLAVEMAALGQDGPSLPGMPEFVLLGIHCLAPAIHEDDDAIWVLWSEPIERPDDQNAVKIDAGLWSSRPLSAYYAAREAKSLLAAQGA